MEAKSEGEEERERRRKKKLASRSLALFSLHNFSFSLSPSLWLSLQRALLLSSLPSALVSCSHQIAVAENRRVSKKKNFFPSLPF
jgi:hypothetical protein